MGDIVAKAKGKNQPVKKGAKKSPQKEDESIRGIIRIAGKDVRGYVPLHKALYHIKGVGKRYANICANLTSKKLGIDAEIPVGKLSDEQLGKVEQIITNPLKNGVPVYILNRRRDYASGEDKHLISNELDFAVKMDIDRDKKMRTWRGISHMYRKKVRGQRTRTSGRRSGSVGVVRKKLQPGKSGK